MPIAGGGILATLSKISPMPIGCLLSRPIWQSRPKKSRLKKPSVPDDLARLGNALRSTGVLLSRFSPINRRLHGGRRSSPHQSTLVDCAPFSLDAHHARYHSLSSS